MHLLVTCIFFIRLNYIFSACPRGYFGKECFQKCSETCAGCNNVNGVCDFGCVSGWTGIFCLSGIGYYL